MSDLIERLEKASEGSRELDRAILDCADPLAHVLRPPLDSPVLPRYTTSIDAALTLVPEGYRYRLWHHASGTFGADIFPTNGGPRPIHRSHAPTQALAICIGALCARHFGIEGGKPNTKEVG